YLFQEQTNGIQKRLGLVESILQLFDLWTNLVRRQPGSSSHTNGSVRSIRTPDPGPRGLKPLGKCAHHWNFACLCRLQRWSGTSSSSVDPILCLTTLSSIPCPRVKEPPEGDGPCDRPLHRNEDGSTGPTPMCH